MFGMKNIRTVPQLLMRVFVRPLFPLGQWVVIKTKLLIPPPRQEFLLGHLSVSPEEAVAYLRGVDFFNNRIAWPDPGQVASLRRLCNEKSGRQYHIRLFDDGEVRGHYERTPEDHPMTHLKRVDFEDRSDQFLIWISPILK